MRPGAGGLARGGDQVVPALRVMAPEDPQGGAVERVGVPLAFDGIDLVPARREHEIHLAAGFVPPVADGQVGEVRLQMLQYQVFPKHAEIVLAERIPAAHMADEAGVEAMDLRHPDEFVAAAAVERADPGDGVGDLRRAQVALDRGARDAQIGGGPGDFEPAAAPAQDVSVEEPVARIRSFGNESAPTFSRRAGSRS